MEFFKTSVFQKNFKESNQHRQTCSQIVASILHSDWTFVTGFVKNLQGKSADDLKLYQTLTPIFIKGIKNNTGIPRPDTVICFQTLLNVYLLEADNMKSKQYRPKKGLSSVTFLLILQSEVFRI